MSHLWHLHSYVYDVVVAAAAGGDTAVGDGEEERVCICSQIAVVCPFVRDGTQNTYNIVEKTNKMTCRQTSFRRSVAMHLPVQASKNNSRWVR